MPATLATVNNITKEVYEGQIQDQLQEEAVGYKRIEATSEGVASETGGKYVTFPIRTRRNSGIGYRQEGEALPSAGQQGYASVRIGLKYGYGRVRLTGQLFELVDSNFQAFASAMDQEMNGLVNDLGKDTSRIFYGDTSATLAVATGVVSGNTIPIKNAQYLEVGQYVDVVVPGYSYNPATGVITATYSVQGVFVYAVDRVNLTVTLSTNTASLVPPTYSGGAVANGSAIVRSGGLYREPNGLGSLVTNTGALFNVDPAIEPSWAAYVDSNAGTLRPLSEGLMIKATDQVRINGGKTSVFLYSLGVRRAYFNLLSQQRRYPTTTEFAGGLTGLAFNNGREIPCVEDIDCPANTMFALEEDSFKIYRSAPWSWMDRAGSIWNMVVDGVGGTGAGSVGRFDAYEAIMHQYWEIGLNRRNANGKVVDLTEG